MPYNYGKEINVSGKLFYAAKAKIGHEVEAKVNNDEVSDRYKQIRANKDNAGDERKYMISVIYTSGSNARKSTV